MTQEYTVIHYIENGKDIFQEWLEDLQDIRGYNAVRKAIDRVEGNLANNRYCRDGVWELKINVSTGYRVYYSIFGKQIILLLCGGSKCTQQKDIDKAVEYLKKVKEAKKWK